SENGTTIRLGGNNVYEFKEKGEAIVLTEFKEIDNYIPNFYGDDISLVSAIVGKNGSGKTSLLRQLDYPIDQRSTGIIYVCEELIDGKLQITIVNQTKSEVFADVNIIVSNRLESINFLFYSPVIDFELTSTRSCVNPSTKFK